MNDSIYWIPESETGRARYFGRFPDLQILGRKCEIAVMEKRDLHPDVVDILGYPSFRVGGIAIHISGFDTFGQRQGPGRIRAIGMFRTVFEKSPHPAGLGCRRPEPAVIVAPECKGWEHFAHFSASRYFLTLEGVLMWATSRDSSEFGLDDVCDGTGITCDKNQRQAVRSLLETCVGVSNHNIPNGGVISRVGRWGYAR